VRDATNVLDGLRYHESDLRIEEHYTDTAGFTDHIFALIPPLGFRFAPRIRDLADKRLYIHGNAKQYPTLGGIIGGNVKQIRAHWDEILRLAASIKQGTVTASLMLRKLGSYPRQNGLAVVLRELGRIERTRFALDWNTRHFSGSSGAAYRVARSAASSLIEVIGGSHTRQQAHGEVLIVPQISPKWEMYLHGGRTTLAATSPNSIAE
jgi:Tn3 transposase DDE domain